MKLQTRKWRTIAFASLTALLFALTTDSRAANPPIPIFVNGATYTDVCQGGSGNCTVLSAIASATRSGVKFTRRITYLGNNRYRVSIYDAERRFKKVIVPFDGTVLKTDAQFNPNGPKESWVILMNRAYFISRNLDWKTPTNGFWAWDTLPAFTGVETYSYWRSTRGMPSKAKDVGPTFRVEDYRRLKQAIWNKKAITAGVPTESAEKDKRLIGGHTYSVVNVYSRVGFTDQGENLNTGWVILRNPWGRDGGKIPSGNPKDGLIKMTWDQFSRLIGGYTISR